MSTAVPPPASDLLGGGPAPTQQARDALRPPAIAMIVVGALGLVVSLIFVVDAVMHDLSADPTARELYDLFGDSLRYAWAVGAWWAAMSLLSIAGGVQMLRLRTRGLAIAAAIAAIVPCAGTYPGCCVLGLPVGVWALVVLMQPQIKASFT